MYQHNIIHNYIYTHSGGFVIIIDEYTTGSEKPDEGGIIGLFLGVAPRSAYIIPPVPVFLLPYIHKNE